MKKLSVCLICALHGIVYAQAQLWMPISSPTGKNLEDIYVFDKNTAIIVGDAGTVFKTTDGGASWSSIPIGTTQPLEAVTFPSATKGYILTRYGDIFISYDKGLSWRSHSNVSSKICESYDIHFTSDMNGYIAGYYYPSDFEKCSQVSPGGGQLLCTADGGSSWIGYGVGSESYYSVYGLSDSNITAAGRPANIARTGLCNCGSACFASNANLPGSGGSSDTNYAVYYRDADLGFIVGDIGRINRTTNGGLSWSDQSGISSARLFGIAFCEDSDTGFVVGKGGVILNTTNGGITWTAGISPVTADLKHIACAGSACYIVGANGTILKSDSCITGVDVGLNDIIHKITIFPNPVNEILTFSVRSDMILDMELRVSNVLGQVIYQEHLVGIPGGYQKQLYFNNLPKGTYILQLISKVGVVSKKVINK